MALCLPRKRSATSLATRPSTLSVASITNHSCFTSAGLALKVFMRDSLEDRRTSRLRAAHLPRLFGKFQVPSAPLVGAASRVSPVVRKCLSPHAFHPAVNGKAQ